MEPETLASGCAFCSADIIEPQIIGENGAFMLAADLAPLVEGHVLLLPRQHLSCFGALPPDLVGSAEELKSQVAEFLRARYGAPTFFEHGVAGQTVPHAHLHAVPGLPELLPAISAGRVAVPAAGIHDLGDWYRARGPYLYCEEGGAGWLLEPGAPPPGYIVEVAASRLPAGTERPHGRAVAERVRQTWQQHRAVTSGAVINLVACFLRRDDRLCLLLRSPVLTSAANKWHVVSGYLPVGVRPLEHALREIHEETGLASDQVRLERTGEPLVLQRPDDVRRWLVHSFLFEVLSGEPRLNWEHVDLRWVRPEDLTRYDAVRWLPLVLDRLLPGGV